MNSLLTRTHHLLTVCCNNIYCSPFKIIISWQHESLIPATWEDLKTLYKKQRMKANQRGQGFVCGLSSSACLASTGPKFNPRTEKKSQKNLRPGCFNLNEA